MEIRSYRAVFDLERRIYRVDRLRLNPGGIPVRGVVYCLAILAGLALAGALPLLGTAVRALPWYLRDLLLPGGSAALLTMIRVEGRPFHLAATALARHTLGPRQLAGLATAFDGGSPERVRSAVRPRSPGASPAGVWRPEELLILPDGSDPGLRGLRYTGPGAVLVRVAHERSTRGSGVLGRLTSRSHVGLREPPGTRTPASGQVIALERGARLRVR
jgi:hypothetical protein